MRFTYRLIEDRGGYTAECVESEALGAGATAEAAIAALREALRERMLRPDAVAPPPRDLDEPIELALAATPSNGAINDGSRASG